MAYLSRMEQLCFISDFPGREEEKYYKLIGSVSNAYTLYSGGNYIFIKNKNGKTVRFTGKDLSRDAIRDEQINTWLENLQKLYPRF
ncbi:hypothetical protein [Agriterribacter sp.]|uniref:hypothetical protein n=1 Tax=Agriterribacter sp. TaxID=2821509 RepID=UPI002BB19A7A|nr:hypothetical protein [Agriterribacter sp.]HRO46315.1 hypothetical protein [Agriterribacter sp.]HRQ19235.1 hypothetical protein [Agriterribacter sp.]